MYETGSLLRVRSYPWLAVFNKFDLGPFFIGNGEILTLLEKEPYKGSEINKSSTWRTKTVFDPDSCFYLVFWQDNLYYVNVKDLKDNDVIGLFMMP